MRYLPVSFTLCAAIVSAVLGCDQGADQVAKNESTATSCTVIRATAPWWNQSFSEQTARFTATFTVTPSASNVDAVIGLSDGAATSWTKLAAIVRFNPQGLVDVRFGSEYRAQQTYYYQPGHTYSVRFTVDVTQHTYAVTITETPWYESTRVVLASGATFRTEQAGVTKLNNVASYINPQTSPSTSSIELCGFTAYKDDRTLDNCLVTSPSEGFRNTPVVSSAGGLVVMFTAQPTATNMDGVVGVADGEVDAYNDYAASVRFWTNGMIEARDGDGYRADVPMSYVAGQQYLVRLVVDVPTKTYSVFVGNVELARGYRFRTQQQAVPKLGDLSVVVASSFGAIAACQIKDESNLSMREGKYDALPLANDARLISDGTRTELVDATGKDIASVAVGGKLAVDGAGNLYVARVVNPHVVVDSYTPALAPRWHFEDGDGFYGIVSDLAIGANGDMLIAFASDDYYATPYHVLRISPDHLVRSSIWLPDNTSAVAVADDGYVIAHGGIEMYGWDAQLQWSRTFPGASITHVARAHDGTVVFGGEIWQTTDFGTGPLEPYWTPDGESINAYYAVLGPDHATQRAEKLNASYVRGLAINDGYIGISSQLRTQLGYPSVGIMTRDGSRGTGASVFLLSDLGDAGRISVSPTGRLYANVGPKLYAGADEVWYLITYAL